MKHNLHFLAIGAVALALSACGGSSESETTDDENKTDVQAIPTDSTEGAELINPSGTPVEPDDATKPDTTSVAEQAKQDVDPAKYDYDMDLLEQSIQHILEVAPKVKDGDPEAAVRLANTLNKAKSRLNSLKAAGDAMTEAQRQRLSALAASLQNASN